jgi:outer membrane biosynthesis protein TonB
VFSGFVIAITWKLLSGSHSEAPSVAAASPSPPSAPPTPTQVVAPPAPADASAPEVEVDKAEVVPAVDAGAVEVVPAVDAGVVARPDKHSGTHLAPPPRSPDTSPPADAQVAVPQPPTPPAHAEQTADGCDEVACVLSHYEQACCAKYKPAHDDFKPTSGIPDELTRPMVRAAVAVVKPRISACNDKVHATGTVKLAVTVDGEGSVSSVDVAEAPDPTLGNCVAAAMRGAKFGKSKSGGTFTYPFVF